MPPPGSGVRRRRPRAGIAVGCRCRRAGEPDFVDDHEVGAQQAVDDPADGVVGQAAVEGVDQVGGGEVAHLVTGMDGGVTEPDEGV